MIFFYIIECLYSLWIFYISRTPKNFRNKRSIDGIESTLKQAAQDTPKNANEPKVNYSVLFRRVMLVKTLCTSAMWLITGMIYYGFNQYLSQTSRDPFISVALAGLIQVNSKSMNL